MTRVIEHLIGNSYDEVLTKMKKFECENTGREQYSSKFYGDNVKCVEDVICDSYEAAIEYTDKKIEIISGLYIAVRFHDLNLLKETKQMQNVRDRMTKNREALRQYEDNSNVKNQKSKMITCAHCGSKLNKEYIINSKCPLCETSLSSNTVNNRIKKFNDDYKNLIILLYELKLKNKDNAPIRWCMRVEI